MKTFGKIRKNRENTVKIRKHEKNQMKKKFENFEKKKKLPSTP